MSSIPDKIVIEEAAKRIRPFVHRTPVFTSTIIDRMAGCTLFFKCENLQKAGAFKSRGAVNAVFSLPEEEIQQGVCTHSSGNHAAALSRAASLRNTKAYIIMPENSSRVKVEAVKHYGGIIHFCAPNLESRETTLRTVQKQTGAREIHPYNDYQVIAGQATAAKELLEEIGKPDYVVAPVGGGGLLSGTALAVRYFGPGVKTIAAEPKGADDAYRSFERGEFVPSVDPVTIADGLLTSLGDRTFPLIQENVSKIFTVTETGIVDAMKLVWERMKLLIEPSSAVPLAAVFEHPAYFSGKRIGIIVSGGNVDLLNLPW